MHPDAAAAEATVRSRRRRRAKTAAHERSVRMLLDGMARDATTGAGDTQAPS